jgi:hypothetical protein
VIRLETVTVERIICDRCGIHESLVVVEGIEYCGECYARMASQRVAKANDQKRLEKRKRVM